MQININGKNYELNFGVRFVMLMNKNHNVDSSGLKLGMGINQAASVIAQKDVVGLAEIIECATWINKNRPTVQQIYAYIDDPKTDIDKLFKQINHELNTANATKSAVKNVMKAMKNAQNKAMKKNLTKLDSTL